MSALELLLLILAIFGGIDLAARGWGWLVSVFPRMLTLQARAWRYLADWLSLPLLRRRAVATRVDEVLNQTAFTLRQHLPKGWVKRAKIRWVRDSKSAQFREGELLLRIRPNADPDTNLFRALTIYFESALFPDSHDLIPRSVLSSIALAISRSSIEEKHPYLLDDFDRKFLNLVSEVPEEIRAQVSDYIRLNQYGLLMGPYVRELDYMVNQLRYRVDRGDISKHIRDIADHMLSFQPLLRLNKPEEEWFFRGTYTSYGFLLISRPPEIRPGIDAYVKRAKQHVDAGIQRIYIIGRDEEREFVAQVMTAILSLRELKGIELFTLYRDYRGNPEGFGALIGVDSFISKLSPPSRAIPTPASQSFQERISRSSESLPELTDQDNTADRDLRKITEEIIVQLSDYDGEWISLADFGSRIRQELPGFTPERYGGRNLASVLRKLDFLEFDERGLGPAKAVYVRISDQTDPVRDQPNHSSLFDMVATITRQYSGDDGWAPLASLGHHLKVHIENFHPTMIGASSLHEFIAQVPTVEVEERGHGHSKTYVRALSFSPNHQDDHGRTSRHS